MTTGFEGLSDWEAWKLRRLRKKHIRNGHPRGMSTPIEKQYFHKHPKNNDDFIFMVVLYKCNECGLHWTAEYSGLREMMEDPIGGT